MNSWDSRPVKMMEVAWDFKKTPLEGNESIFRAYLSFVHLSMRNFLLYALFTTVKKAYAISRE